MDCIKCPGQLQRKMVNGVEIDQCQDCGGIWFDAGELDWLLSVPQLQLEDQTKVKSADTERAPCPRCGGVGNMVQLVQLDGDFHIDACPSCSGRWLDGGELVQLRNIERQSKLRDFMKNVR